MSTSILLIGVIIAFCVYHSYQKRKHRHTPFNGSKSNEEDVNNKNTVDRSQQSSQHSIYDEIELYEAPRTQRAQPTSPYTVLTRDPYGYDELYGLQRRIAILIENSDQNNEEQNDSTSGFKAISLPTDLNAMVDDHNKTIGENEYVDMLPEKLEAPGANVVRGCMERSKSMSDVVKFVKGMTNDGK